MQIVTAIVLIIIILYAAFAYFLSRTVIHLDRQPVPKNPKDYGMEFQNIEFQAEDKVNLKGWPIPAKSNKLVVITHVGGLTKYGSTREFSSFSKLYNEEIEFLKIARHLYDEAYNVLMFDFRNHSESDPSPNGGKAAIGLEEYKDVSAATTYIQNNETIKDMDVGFVSFCTGANSTIIAMSKEPNKNRNVKCLVAIQPTSMEVFVRTYLKRRFSPLGAKLLFPLIKIFVNIQSEHRLEDMSPADFVKDIKVPTLYVQTRNDPWTEPSDILGFYENTSAPKELYYLEGLSHRSHGYQYFGEHPEKMLEWLKKYL